MKSLHQLETPALVLDAAALDRNIERMRAHLGRLRTVLRPHVKTAKSIDIVRRVLGREPPAIAVSTLKEAEYFLAHGISNILYAVGIAPGKLAHAEQIVRSGAQLTLVLDSVAATQALERVRTASGVVFTVLIELDVDGHRAGIAPESDQLIEVAREIDACAGIELRGVMTHAGESYNCRSAEALRAMAERERAGAVLAAERLRRAGFAAPVVSVGSTPTATFATDLTGVTEVRAGVYMFQDLVMAGLGVCGVEEIALSVLVSVIGHQPARNWIITDGGWMALSRDRGTSAQPVDQGYGLVRDVAGGALDDDLIVCSANQEHGVIARRDGQRIDISRYPIGTLLRVLPNHACATAAQHSRYHVISGDPREVLTTWDRINGW